MPALKTIRFLRRIEAFRNGADKLLELSLLAFGCHRTIFFFRHGRAYVFTAVSARSATVNSSPSSKQRFL